MKFNKETWTRLAMAVFIISILLFVPLSSYVYFNNSSNIEVKISTDNAVNKEKTAVNEALTKTLVMKNDSIETFKKIDAKKDSIIFSNSNKSEKIIKKLQHEKDSLNILLRKFKPSDIEPVSKP